MKILPKHTIHKNVLHFNSNSATASSPAATIANAISMFLPSDDNKKNSHVTEENHETEHHFQDEFLTDPKPIVERWIDTVKNYWWALGIGGIGALAYAIINAKIYRYKMGEAEQAHQQEKKGIKDKVNKLAREQGFSLYGLDEIFSSSKDENIKLKIVEEVLNEEKEKYKLNEAKICAISTSSGAIRNLNLDRFQRNNYESQEEYEAAMKSHVRTLLPEKIKNLKIFYCS